MRRVCYAVAMSLDGYVAGPNGEADWIVMDPEIDFGSFMVRFDTVLMGRKTFEATRSYGGGAAMSGVRAIVASRTLKPSDHPDVEIVSDGLFEVVKVLRTAPGKEIWLFGGGELFRSLLDAGLVDRVEVGVIPVLLGGGIPLLPSPAARAKLKLTGYKVYSSGVVGLEYETA